MARVIIVVGPDGAGKTPLCGLLHKMAPGSELRKVVHKATADSSQDKLVRSNQEVDLWDSSGEKLFIYDRFPVPDEWVYMSAYSEYKTEADLPRAPGKDWEVLMRRMSYHKVAYVLLWPDDEEAYLKKKQEEPDEQISSEWLPVMLKRYKLWWNACRFPLFVHSVPFYFREVYVDTYLQNILKRIDPPPPMKWTRGSGPRSYSERNFKRRPKGPGYGRA